MTSSGVEHNLSVSPYIVRKVYGEKEVIYYFSTSGAMARFEECICSNRDTLCDSLNRRFKIKFYLSPMFCDVMLYKKVESRGFRIVINGRVIEWLKELEYNGQELTLAK